MTNRNVLVICPHTDDELGCCGLLLKLIAQGSYINYRAISTCDSDILVSECRSATTILGLTDIRLHTLPVHRFPENRQKILELFLSLNKSGYDLVIIPSSYDTNQDHATVYQEAFRAFKHTSVIGYEQPQNMMEFRNPMFVKITEEQLNTKIRAIKEYKSQAYRPYMAEDYIRGLARVRGVQCNSMYAESYEVIRWII